MSCDHHPFHVALQLKALDSHVQEVCQSCDLKEPPQLIVGQSAYARYQQDSDRRDTLQFT